MPTPEKFDHNEITRRGIEGNGGERRDADIEDAYLVEQLHGFEEIAVGDEKIRIFDAAPSPEALKSNIPVVIGPGLLQDAEKHRELMFQLAKRGRRVISFTAPHGVESEESMAAEQLREFPEAEARKIAALLSAMDSKGIERADYVGHSEGVIYGLMAAIAFPERFRNLILSSPVGLKEEDTPLGITVRFMKELASAARQDVNPQKPSWVEKIGTKAGREGDVYDSTWSRSLQERQAVFGRSREIAEAAKAFSLDSLKKLWQEVRAISETQIKDLLPRLKAQGVNVVFTYGVEGKTMPGEVIQERLEAEEISGLYSLKGGHFTMHWAPKKYSALIDHTLSALEQKGTRKRADDLR